MFFLLTKKIACGTILIGLLLMPILTIAAEAQIGGSFYNSPFEGVLDQPESQDLPISQGETFRSASRLRDAELTGNIQPADGLSAEELERALGVPNLLGGGVGEQTGIAPQASCGPTTTGYRLCVPLPFLPQELPGNSIGYYVNAIYRFALGIAGLLVFGTIVYYGIQYTLSVGNTALITDAREGIMQAIYGLVLLFLSYIILNTINPNIVSFGRLEQGLRPAVVRPVDKPAFQSSRESEFIERAGIADLDLNPNSPVARELESLVQNANQQQQSFIQSRQESASERQQIDLLRQQLENIPDSDTTGRQETLNQINEIRRITSVRDSDLLFNQNLELNEVNRQIEQLQGPKPQHWYQYVTNYFNYGELGKEDEEKLRILNSRKEILEKNIIRTRTDLQIDRSLQNP